MGVISVYDWDYFHYSHVIPNLECGKLIAYNREKKNITILSKDFEPERFTKIYFRKEYDDGIYNNFIYPNVEYGGRAFSSIYKPLDLECELIEPNFEGYFEHKNLYGTTQLDKD